MQMNLVGYLITAGFLCLYVVIIGLLLLIIISGAIGEIRHRRIHGRRESFRVVR